MTSFVVIIVLVLLAVALAAYKIFDLLKVVIKSTDESNSYMIKIIM
jgi:hypothetical protein